MWIKYLGERKASAERGERGVGWKVLRPEGGWNTNPWGANETGVTLATSTIFCSWGGEGFTAATTSSRTWWNIPKQTCNNLSDRQTDRQTDRVTLVSFFSAAADSEHPAEKVIHSLEMARRFLVQMSIVYCPYPAWPFLYLKRVLQVVY